MEFKCTCHNSGTNSFSGKCSNCGMTKPSQGVTISNSSEPYKTIHQNKSELEQFYSKKSAVEKMQPLQMIENLKTTIIQLQRYDASAYDGVVEDNDGGYVKIEDVLNLFSAEKE